WAEKNPEVVQCVAAVAAGVAVFAALTVGVGLAIAAFHALNAVMMANPFILVAAAIAGVATALVSFGVLAASSADDTDNLAKRSGELRDAFAETKVAYDELSSSLASEGSNVTSLVGALDAAINSSANTAAQQAVILDLVGKLNEAIPNLGLSYDSATNSLVNYTTESLQGMASSAVATEKNNAATARLSELYTEQAKISEDATAAQEKLAEQQAVAAESTESVTHRMDAYSYTVNEATVASYATQRAINDLTEAQEENAAEIASLTAETEAYAAEQEAAHGATRDLDTALSDVSGSMSDLSAAYQESYDNALKSIGGQFGLFDTLKTEVELSVSDMITAMKSQVAYMAEYSENLKAATNLGLDEGLLAQLSDGSKESAAYLDAIVASGKNGVAQLNLAFAEVENGKEAFAGTVSELEEGFTDAMDALKTELSTTIGEMNLNQEASESGKNTVQGFIDSANDMLPAVKRAYAAVAEAAVAAIEENLDIHSPSRRLYATGEMAMAGHINAVRDADQDVREAYAEAADSGVDAMAEESMRIVAMSPQLMEALSWRTAAVTESAQYIAPAGGGAPVTLYITYDLSAASDIESVKSLLREHDADLERLVRRVVANDMADQRRGAFV
ncbi:MAG: hypothetical protein RR949_01605, partial [Oscillospiraceae bacterium]